MSLQETIKNDLKIAMKNKQQDVVSILRVVIGEFSREGKILNDDKALKIIKKTSNDAAETNNDNEVKILGKYLPQMYGESKLTEIVENIINENNLSTIKDLGKLMGIVNQRDDKNMIDNKIISNLAKDKLS